MGGPAYERLQEPADASDAFASGTQETASGLSRQSSLEARPAPNWSRRSSFRRESGVHSQASRQGSFTQGSTVHGSSRRSSHMHLGPLGALQDEYQSRPRTPQQGEHGPGLAIAGGLISKTHLLTTLQLTGITFFAVAGVSAQPVWARH
jgi:hypothetical protein